MNTRSRAGFARLAVSLAAAVLVGACASYQPRPLPDAPRLAGELDALLMEQGPLAGISGGSRKLTLDDGLDLVEVGMFAVAANPDLQAYRAQLQVAAAQVYAAGLLPDPQLVAGFDRPTGNAAPDTGWMVGLDWDPTALIVRSATRDAAAADRDRVRLDLLWKEWQVIQQAQVLAVRLQQEEQQLQLLVRMRDLYRDRYRHSRTALDAGDVTVDVTGTDLTALVDTLSQIHQLEQTRNATRHAFNLLLGLAPERQVALAPLPAMEPVEGPVASARLEILPQVRPDLLALKAGYESQEARVRGAILAQFPSLGIGINRARDTSNVDTLGLSISLGLPLLSGNRGNIAIERATREQLYQEYSARLAQAWGEVDQLLELQSLLQAQQRDLADYVPRLEDLVGRAARAYHRGDIDALTFLNLESTWVNKRLEQITLLQSSWENRIALDALLALPWNPAAEGEVDAGGQRE
jgi:cobalt-zinc-cadmium efflux system outer membrane protein